MPSYLVTWSIDIDMVNDEREAAEEALKIMRDPESLALCFKVRGRGKKAVAVDLEHEETAAEELERSVKR